MKRILITGAGSYVGMSFANYISRWPDAYQVDTVDMQDPDWQNRSFAGYDAVYHVAGIAHADSGAVSKEKEALYYAINRDLAVKTAEKAKADGAGQFIFMSSAIVYGNSAPIGKSMEITAETPCNPASCYGDSKLQAEKGLRALESQEFPVVIIRAPMIYGPGCKGNYPVLARLARILPVFPAVENSRSMLYIENLCEFIRLMVENRERGLFWPQNREYTNTAEMVRMIAQVNGKKIFLIKGCTWILKLLSHCTGLVNKAFGSLNYARNLSTYKEDYQIISFDVSILRTEGKRND